MTQATLAHPKVSREDIVGGDHHILRGQKLLAPVAIGAIVQIHVYLDVSTHVLLKLVLEAQTHTQRGIKWKCQTVDWFNAIHLI